MTRRPTGVPGAESEQMTDDKERYDLMTDDNPLVLAQELADSIRADARLFDASASYPYSSIETLRGSGLLGLLVPRDHGGMHANALQLANVLKVIAEADSSVAQIFQIHNYGVAMVNGVNGTEDFVAEMNKRIVDGAFITNAFTEVTTSRVEQFGMTLQPGPDGDSILDGTKFYCTGSLGGDIVYVMALDANQEPRVAFVDTDAPGVTIADDWDGMGQRATGSGTMVFEHVRVGGDRVFAVDHMSSPESLWGSLGQLMFSAIHVGIARAALKEGFTFARTKARPWPLSGVDQASRDPYVLLRSGEFEVSLRAAEAALERAARVRMKAEQYGGREWRDRCSVATAEAKWATDRAALLAAGQVFKICGTSSATRDMNLDRHWRNARTLTLHDPLDYKLHLIGNYILNEVAPPISAYI
jgi:alkylation response protein AidB-like acyl-CoA dehydrogenase